MNQTYIIAEAGVNHNGSLDRAMIMIESAKKAGVDAIKFQSFKAEKLVAKIAQLAEYQRGSGYKNQYEMLKNLEFGTEEFSVIKTRCNELDIDFISSPFDIDSLSELMDIGVDIIKIPSGEITNLPLLRKISKANKKIILSTGMSTIFEIQMAIDVLDSDKNDLSLLHCNTQYPTPFCDVNLLAIRTMFHRFGLPVGYSDHTLGIEVSIAAVSLGATIIEKHFTLDKDLSGPDHKASVDTEELARMVWAIRNIERALGDGIKRVMPSEIDNKDVVRKSIVASRDIKTGEMLNAGNITTKRPGNGMSPMDWDRVIGTFATKNFCKDELIIL